MRIVFTKPPSHECVTFIHLPNSYSLCILLKTEEEKKSKPHTNTQVERQMLKNSTTLAKNMREIQTLKIRSG